MKTFTEWADDNNLFLELGNDAVLAHFEKLVQQHGIQHPFVKKIYQANMNDPQMLQSMQAIVAQARQESGYGNKLAQGMNTQAQIATSGVRTRTGNFT